ncbi:MAG: FG-GAP-like repeat-containing protein, partial [Candidatus Polarisedimenticolia bacterium]
MATRAGRSWRLCRVPVLLIAGLFTADPVFADEPILVEATTLDGQGENTPLGYTVGQAGDVNRDGYGDVLVGLPNYSGEFGQEGRVLLFLGGPGGISSTPAWTRDGGAQTAHFGNAVAGAGDVNGDGFDDVIIGAPDYPNDTDPWNDDGRAYVFLGTEGGLQGSPVWSADSGDFRTDFGFSVASAGDVNGDGFDDIIVGDYLCCFEAGRRGRAYVFHGSNGGPRPTANWSVEGDTDFLFYGYGVAPAGDVNRDGIDDVFVSGYGTTGAGNSYNGRVSLYLGSPAGLGSAVWTVAGTQAGEQLGRAIAGAGDVYGDGYPDLVVSSANGFHGVVSIYNGTAQGLAQTPSWSVTGPDLQGDYGVLVAGPGDVSGDGYEDIIFARQYSDQVFLFTGSPSGPLLGPAQTLTGPAGSRFGAALSGAGDADGNGGLDVLVGAPNYFASGATTGRIVLFRGRPPTVQFIDPACKTETECDGDYLKELDGQFVLDADPQNFSRLLEAPVRRRGTTTDGVSRLLLR